MWVYQISSWFRGFEFFNHFEYPKFRWKPRACLPLLMAILKWGPIPYLLTQLHVVGYMYIDLQSYIFYRYKLCMIHPWKYHTTSSSSHNPTVGLSENYGTPQPHSIHWLIIFIPIDIDQYGNYIYIYTYIYTHHVQTHPNIRVLMIIDYISY